MRYYKKHLYRFKLKKEKIAEINLKTCYPQQTPNRSLDSFFLNGFTLECSPHAEMAQIILTKRKWLKKHYPTTRYFSMMKYIGRSPRHSLYNFIRLYYSMKNGYLRGVMKNHYIIVLNKPFAQTRYGREVNSKRVPEIWCGHHRASLLLAMNIHTVCVLIAYDAAKGKKNSPGKIHQMCLKS